MKKPNKWLNKKAIIFAACIAALAALLAILNLAQPSLEMIEAGIPPSFEEGAGTRFAKAETNYLAFRIVRASNLRTAEKLTFIGFAGKVFEIAPDTFASGVADVLFWLPALMRGTRITVSLTIVSVAAGLVASVFLALGKISRYKALSKMCGAYIFFFRGTPLLMQLFFVYYALPEINPALTINNKFAAAFIAFAMNSSAYCAEIIRAAIQSIDKGQFEAAQTLGHSYAQTMSLIIIPQAIRRLIPPVAN
ncbi:MAG: amino acid ABC transporter permease, partial [Eubacteriaceae bacterium]|nr:amino acid ABC transporter permease [Eubacteriaceae bacterium]